MSDETCRHIIIIIIITITFIRICLNNITSFHKHVFYDTAVAACRISRKMSLDEKNKNSLPLN